MTHQNISFISSYSNKTSLTKISLYEFFFKKENFYKIYSDKTQNGSPIDKIYIVTYKLTAIYSGLAVFDSL
jgi:hypothetical protein